MVTIVVHSTEGSSIEGAVRTLRANRSESNWVIDPETDEIETLTDSASGDRSLRNRPGGVETNNRAGVYQVEVVGFAKDIPNKPEIWFETLGRQLRALADRVGCPKRFPYPFRPYPASYGLKAAQRLSNKQWNEVEGFVGHQHVPENDHGDPGDISRVIPYVTGSPMTNPFEAEVNEALLLLRQHGGYQGDLDGNFGPQALAALHGLKGYAVEKANQAEACQKALSAAQRPATGPGVPVGTDERWRVLEANGRAARALEEIATILGVEL